MGDTWFRLGEMILVNLVLSGDNALLIAMATSRLPARQRKLAMLFGIFAAMVLRAALTEAAAQLIHLPYVRAVGALLLAAIAWGLTVSNHSGDSQRIYKKSAFWPAVGTILVADLTMSLDNVAALAGMAEDNFSLLVAGLAISMLFMLVASASISVVLERFPPLLLIGSGVLAYTAGKLLAEDKGLSLILGQYSWIPLVLVCVIWGILTLPKMIPK